MKNIISLILTIVFINTLYGQKEYSISFDKDDFTFKESENGYYILLDDNNYFLLEDTTLPALPYISVNILIPEDTDIENISVAKTEMEILKNVNIASNPPLMPTSGLFQQATSKVTYTEDKYPDENVQLQSKNTMQGFTFVSFIVCPFIYNVKEKNLTMITNFDISFDVIDATSTKSETAITKRYDMEDVITNLVINSSELSSLYTTKSTALKSISSDIEYLIITSEDLISDFIPLKAWKIQKGITTEIISTSDIYSNYSGITNQLKIKNCLLDYYNNKKLKWVLLGGDNTIIPVQGCYGKVYTSSGYKIDETIPCDLFYACFDNTFNWNDDDDGIIGETTDNVDMSPEIYISRAPIRTSNHVKAFVNKTLDYEKCPNTSNYVNTLLLTGTELWNTWDGESDAHQRSEIMYSTYISPNWSGTKTKFYDTGTDFSGDASYDLSSTNLQTQLNSGYHFVHMATHGSQTTWSMETGSSYSSTNAASLSNQKKSIIITIACITNAFDNAKYTSDPCLSEAFIRNSDGGCVLYLGSSRYGWGYSSQIISLGPSFQYNARFFNNLFTGQPSAQPYKFGAVTTISKSYFISSSSSYGANRWLQFSLNAIGDPELSIYTDNPIEFSSASVSQSGTTVTVNTGGVSGCTIVLTSVDFGTTYFDIEEDVSSATFTNVDCPYYVTITKHNYIPFQYPTDVYIQNFTFSSDAYIYGRNIYVGDNVIPFSTQGDVIINNGVNVIFEAEQNIIFDSGFEAELGGTFEVR